MKLRTPWAPYSTRHGGTNWQHAALLLAVLVLLSLLCANTATTHSQPPDLSQSTVSRRHGSFPGSAKCGQPHGLERTGTVLGPDLSDSEWHRGTGSYETILRLLAHCVIRRESAQGTPMHVRAFASRGDQGLTAVPTYVRSLSHPTPGAPSPAVDSGGL